LLIGIVGLLLVLECGLCKILLRLLLILDEVVDLLWVVCGYTSLLRHKLCKRYTIPWL
jgi:hypothetical protein